jgi:N-methylhydantoinase A
VGVTINIDTGGTFTDGYFTRHGAAERIKVDTTPHDLTECLAKCIAAGAEKLGYDGATGLLLDAEAIRFSSTIGTNSIIQRSGPRIGLLVSAGAGEDLYADGDSPLREFMVRPELVRELADPHDQAAVRRLVRELLVAGVRILVISLRGSESDPADEQAVKRLITREYPRHYLGAVPCLIASEVTPHAGAARRTATAVVNAYLHADMVRVLYKADEDLRQAGAGNPLLIVHASGAVARVAKTRAIETYNSGPVGGVNGSAQMARRHGLRTVVAMDIGGTSTDVSVIIGGAVPTDPDPSVSGIPVLSPMVLVNAVGGGGGSIAARAGDGYTVGPKSVGAAPGPACYGLGGTEPTATDAEVVLGHVDPEWFLAGRRRLDPARAQAAIAAIAGTDPVPAAAWEIHRALVAVAATAVREALSARGADPAQASLFAFGGGGGLYGAEVAVSLGIPRVYCFETSSVFSAAGISAMDVGHVYELATVSEERLDELRERARLDARGEGFDPAALEFAVERDDDGGGRLRAWIAMPTPEQTPRQPVGEDPAAACKGQRTIHGPGGALTAAVYDRERLAPGNMIAGPALVDAVDTTILVPAGMRLSVDPYGTGIIDTGGFAAGENSRERVLGEESA